MNSYMFRDLSNLFWYGSPRYDRMQQRRGQRKEMGFLESIFSFVFGDGNPNLDFEERRWKMVSSFERSCVCPAAWVPCALRVSLRSSLHLAQIACANSVTACVLHCEQSARITPPLPATFGLVGSLLWGG